VAGEVVADGRSGVLSGQGGRLPITTFHLHLVAGSPLPGPPGHEVTTQRGLWAADGHLHYLPELWVKGKGAV